LRIDMAAELLDPYLIVSGFRWPYNASKKVEVMEYEMLTC